MKLVIAGALAALLAAPAAAQNNRDGAAGGAVGGAAAGAVGGAIVGGPIGAVIGGIGGAAAGATAGSFAPEDRVYVQGYVRERTVEPVVVSEPIAIGKPLPRTVRTYRIEGNPRLMSYNYARVNNQYLLVDADGNVLGAID